MLGNRHLYLITWTLLTYYLQIDFFVLTALVYSAELLTDFSYTNFTVSYRDALDRLRLHLTIILCYNKFNLSELLPYAMIDKTYKWYYKQISI